MLDTSPKQLKAETLPLQGRQLIEASAGTGKTYNITRLYLRLLLEQQLSVEQILVMTFTKAATEEIKGRVAKTLREASAFWEACLDVNDINTASNFVNKGVINENECSCKYKTRRNHCDSFNYFNKDVPQYSIYEISRISVSKIELLVDNNQLSILDIPF